MPSSENTDCNIHNYSDICVSYYMSGKLPKSNNPGYRSSNVLRVSKRTLRHTFGSRPGDSSKMAVWTGATCVKIPEFDAVFNFYINFSGPFDLDIVIYVKFMSWNKATKYLEKIQLSISDFSGKCTPSMTLIHSSDETR